MCDAYTSYFTAKDGTELCFIAKASDLTKSVIICYFNGWVISLDPVVMSRGSLKIRRYEIDNAYIQHHHVWFNERILEALRSPAEDPIFQSPISNPAFTAEFSTGILSKLPVMEMMRFAEKSLKDARAFFDRPKEMLTKEKEYKNQIRDLTARLQKKAQKKKAKQKQIRYNY